MNGMYTVPSLAMLVIFPVQNDWIEGGAPHFKLFNESIRINLSFAKPIILPQVHIIYIFNMLHLLKYFYV